MADEHSLDRQYANFVDGNIEDYAAQQSKESARHAPRQRHAARAKAKPCPDCDGQGIYELDSDHPEQVCESCGGSGTASA